MRYHRSAGVLLPLIFLGAASAHAGPSVVAVSPVPQSFTAGTLSEVTIEFDEAIDPLSVNPSTIMIYGRWSGVRPGDFTFEDADRLVRFIPSQPFSAGEWVTVSVSRGLKSALGDSLDFGYAWNFWTSASPGSIDQTLLEIIEVREPGEPHIQTYGAHAADLNNDGWTDLTLPNEISDDVRVFLNDGTGGYSDFAIHPIPNGNFASTNEAVDMDGDGDLDFVVGNGGNNQMCVFIGDGNGGFESATSYTAGNSVRGVAPLDLDGDGDMDIVTANRSASNLSIFYNNGDGTLQPAIPMEANGSQETACAAADANKDGILDLFVGAHGSGEIILLLGDGQGGLTFSSKVSALGSPWMIAVGDINKDGNVDVVSANSFANNACVVFGDGAGGLSPAVSYPTGAFALAIDVGDLDGDGDLDLVSSNYSGRSWTLYENDGTGTFVNMRTVPASSAGSCATLHDRDNDGDLDMTGIDEIDDLIFIFDNDLSTSVSQPAAAPGSYRLSQNYPNPFNPSTTIRFEIPEGGFVTLTVYDILGRTIETLVSGSLDAGIHTRNWDAAAYPGGVYYYRLQTAGYVESRSLLLLK